MNESEDSGELSNTWLDQPHKPCRTTTETSRLLSSPRADPQDEFEGSWISDVMAYLHLASQLINLIKVPQDDPVFWPFWAS
jgi:hypothetical protein